jgi:hypothetical protein
MAAEVRRADIGFQGGQVLAVRLSPDSYNDLHSALSNDSAGRWHELKTADSDIAIDLSQVVYVRVETEEQRVGF